MDLRSVDHANHATVTMSWNGAIEPNGVGVLDGDGECVGATLDGNVDSAAQRRAWCAERALDNVMFAAREFEGHGVTLLRLDGRGREGVSALADCYVEVCSG